VYIWKKHLYYKSSHIMIVNQIIRKYWHKITKMNSLTTKVRSTPMFAPRTNKSIKKLLGYHHPITHISNTTPSTDYSPSISMFHSCGQTHCFLDKLIYPSPLVKSSITNRSYPIREHLHCTSTNVIYLIMWRELHNAHTTPGVHTHTHMFWITL